MTAWEHAGQRLQHLRAAGDARGAALAIAGFSLEARRGDGPALASCVEARSRERRGLRAAALSLEHFVEAGRRTCDVIVLRLLAVWASAARASR
jgi:hypothetical protein